MIWQSINRPRAKQDFSIADPLAAEKQSSPWCQNRANRRRLDVLIWKNIDINCSWKTLFVYYIDELAYSNSNPNFYLKYIFIFDSGYSFILSLHTWFHLSMILMYFKYLWMLTVVDRYKMKIVTKKQKNTFKSAIMFVFLIMLPNCFN